MYEYTPTPVFLCNFWNRVTFLKNFPSFLLLLTPFNTLTISLTNSSIFIHLNVFSYTL